MDVAQQISLSALDIEVFVKIFFNKADTNEMCCLILILSENFVGLFLPGHRIMIKCWRDQHSSLPHQVALDYIRLRVVHLTDSSVLFNDNLILVQLLEKLFDFLTGIIFVIKVFEKIDVIYHEGTEVSCIIIVVPATSVQQFHELNQTLIKDVELILR